MIIRIETKYFNIENDVLYGMPFNSFFVLHIFSWWIQINYPKFKYATRIEILTHKRFFRYSKRIKS